MEAGHRGAGRDRSMGLNIMLPFEQESNEIIRGDAKLVTMKYFFTRKLMFVKECDAVVCLPGGFGTLDEAFEVLTLLQTGKRELMPLVFLDAPGGTYWHDWLAFIETNLLAGRMISPDDLSLFRVTDSVDETVAEIAHFYRVFHSMEYVPDRLVFRLRHRPTRRAAGDAQPRVCRHPHRRQVRAAAMRRPARRTTPNSRRSRGWRFRSTAATTGGCGSSSIGSTRKSGRYWRRLRFWRANLILKRLMSKRRQLGRACFRRAKSPLFTAIWRRNNDLRRLPWPLLCRLWHRALHLACPPSGQPTKQLSHPANHSNPHRTEETHP